MTYLNNNFKAFMTAQQEAILEPVRSESRLRNFLSPTDARAWNDTAEDRRQHTFEYTARDREGVRLDKCFPFEIILRSMLTGRNIEIEKLRKKLLCLEKCMAIYSKIRLTPEQQKQIYKLRSEMEKVYGKLDCLNGIIGTYKRQIEELSNIKNTSGNKCQTAPRNASKAWYCVTQHNPLKVPCLPYVISTRSNSGGIEFADIFTTYGKHDRYIECNITKDIRSTSTSTCSTFYQDKLTETIDEYLKSAAKQDEWTWCNQAISCELIHFHPSEVEVNPDRNAKSAAKQELLCSSQSITCELIPSYPNEFKINPCRNEKCAAKQDELIWCNQAISCELIHSPQNEVEMNHDQNTKCTAKQDTLICFNKAISCELIPSSLNGLEMSPDRNDKYTTKQDGMISSNQAISSELIQSHRDEGQMSPSHCYLETEVIKDVTVCYSSEEFGMNESKMIFLQSELEEACLEDEKQIQVINPDKEYLQDIFYQSEYIKRISEELQKCYQQWNEMRYQPQSDDIFDGVNTYLNYDLKSAELYNLTDSECSIDLEQVLEDIEIEKEKLIELVKEIQDGAFSECLHHCLRLDNMKLQEQLHREMQFRKYLEQELFNAYH